MGDVGQKMSGPEASAQRPFIDDVTLQSLIKQEQALYRTPPNNISTAFLYRFDPMSGTAASTPSRSSFSAKAPTSSVACR